MTPNPVVEHPFPRPLCGGPRPAMTVDRRLAVAPMMDCTDRHARFFLRLLSRRTLLYTEMITSAALRHGHRGRLLDFHPDEHPLALQIGGSEPREMALAARLARDWGYDEVNVNVGCPSERVQAGRFGACLMAEPVTVASCVAAMAQSSGLPISVKTRIGIDERDSYDALLDFVGTVADAGCRTFVVHARKAWLRGLSPRENREVPPLRHDRVHRLKADLPHLEVIINGGIDDLDAALAHLAVVDGVMIGRHAYRNPWILAAADERIFGEPAGDLGRSEVIERLAPYVDRRLAEGVRFASISRHLVGLYQGQPGARRWRRHLSEAGHRPGADSRVLLEARQLAETARAGLPPGAPSHRPAIA